MNRVKDKIDDEVNRKCLECYERVTRRRITTREKNYKPRMKAQRMNVMPKASGRKCRRSMLPATCIYRCNMPKITVAMPPKAAPITAPTTDPMRRRNSPPTKPETPPQISPIKKSKGIAERTRNLWVAATFLPTTLPVK